MQAKAWNCLLRTVGVTVGVCKFEAERDRIRFKFRKMTQAAMGQQDAEDRPVARELSGKSRRCPWGWGSRHKCLRGTACGTP